MSLASIETSGDEPSATDPSISLKCDVNIEKTEEEDVFFETDILGWPIPIAHWWFKSENYVSDSSGSGAFKIQNGRRHIIERLYDSATKSKFKYNLKITDLSTQDSGTYFVTVESSLGKSLAQINLTVKPKPKKLDEDDPKTTRLSARRKSRTNDDEDEINKLAHRDSYFFDGSLPEVKTVKKTTAAKTSKFSRERNVTDTSASEFSQVPECGPKNTRGPTIRQKDNREVAGYLDMTMDTCPFFIRPLTNLKVMQKQTAVLECEIPTTEDLQFRWFLNGKRLTPEKDPRYFFEHSGNIHRLVISRAEKALDEGLVLLEARNRSGQVSCKCKISVDNDFADPEDEAYVEEPEKVELPRFVEVPRDYIYVTEDDKVRVTVAVAGLPEPEVQWFHGNNLLVDKNSKENLRIKAKNKNYVNNIRTLKNAITGHRILEIQSIRVDQKGDYSCRVRNRIGKVQHNFKLEVEAKPVVEPPPPKSKKPSLFKKLYKTDHEVARGTTAIIKIGTRKIHTSMSEEEKLKNQLIFKQIRWHENPVFKKLAINERDALRNLQQKNIVAMIDNFKMYPENKHVIVLEALDIELLDHIIIKNRFSEAQVAHLIGQLLIGLDYMHSNGWAHLDLQPSNIMIKGTGADTPVVKIIDFAHAKVSFSS